MTNVSSYPYQLRKGEKSLLVGEGNFSFSKDFLTLNENVKDLEIVTTCKESVIDTFSEFKLNTIKFLQEKGVTVVLNVDATNLKHHPALQNKKFDKVIFNFPHVGGKMKIHLNRKLLRDFFCSACDVLSEGACIVVALCDGQGGTGADGKKRRWDDSWQITETAAQSDLILQEVYKFDIASFPNYVNIGYRSYDKSFHCENAVVHVFKKDIPPSILNNVPDLSYENLTEDLVFEFIFSKMTNPLSNPYFASSYICDILIEKMGLRTIQQVLEFDCSTNYIDDNHFKEVSFALDQLCIRAKEESNTSDNIVVKSIMKRKPFNLEKFALAPVTCQIIIFAPETFKELLQKYLCEILLDINSRNSFNVIKKCTNKKIEDFYLSSDCSTAVAQTFVTTSGISCHVVHVDEFAKTVFNISNWRTLWNGKIQRNSLGQPTFQPKSLFPRSYAFDLGLSVPLQIKNEFKDKLYLILWLLAGDMIVDIEHLTTYFPTDRELVCYCYRITYQSFNAPLFRKRVIFIHEKIIANIISKTLNVNIT